MQMFFTFHKFAECFLKNAVTDNTQKCTIWSHKVHLKCLERKKDIESDTY